MGEIHILPGLLDSTNRSERVNQRYCLGGLIMCSSHLPEVWYKECDLSHVYVALLLVNQIQCFRLPSL